MASEPVEKENKRHGRGDTKFSRNSDDDLQWDKCTHLWGFTIFCLFTWLESFSLCALWGRDTTMILRRKITREEKENHCLWESTHCLKLEPRCHDRPHLNKSLLGRRKWESLLGILRCLKILRCLLQGCSKNCYQLRFLLDVKRFVNEDWNLWLGQLCFLKCAIWTGG